MLPSNGMQLCSHILDVLATTVNYDNALDMMIIRWRQGITVTCTAKP